MGSRWSLGCLSQPWRLALPHLRWSQVGEEPPSRAFRVERPLVQTASIWTLEEGEGTVPDTPQGTVYIALSFHTNFYHSYRGDTVDDEGFGVDIDVI